MSEAIVTQAETFPHPDSKYTNIQLANVLNNTVIVSKDVKNGELGIYFDTECQILPEFATANKMYKALGGYLEENGRVRAIKLTGIKSVGIWLPLSTLAFTGADLTKLKVGDRFRDLNKIPIVQRYESEAQRKHKQRQEDRAPLTRVQKWQMKIYRYFFGTAGSKRFFPKHYDTSKFGEVLATVKPPYLFIITEKLHGTSARQGRVMSHEPVTGWKALVNRLLRKQVFKGTLVYRDVYGSRNVDLGNVAPLEKFNEDFKEGYRAKYANQFKERLLKNEVIFYEIVGYTPNGKAIMQNHNPEKVDKAFAKIWGKQMVYAYGNAVGESRVYLYRIALVNEDGQMFEMPWSYVKKRAVELGMELVPELEIGSGQDVVIDYGNRTEEIFFADYMKEQSVKLGEGASILSPYHIKEGVCVRFESANGIKVGKAKNFEFLMMESRAKDSNDYIDLEEVS